MEKYLLRTGKFSLFCSWFFRVKYQKDIQTLIHFFEEWALFQKSIGVHIADGFHPYEIYSTLYFTHNWSYQRFEKTVHVCLYTKQLHMPTHNNFTNQPTPSKYENNPIPVPTKG